MNKWTNDQLEAITNSGGSLLVSAAAGSGKTAVLVERIIRKLDKIPVNKFLVVTFTKSAASEMKEKIVEAISKAVLENPQNKFLRNQLALVHKSQITTIHSFCFSVIREYASFLNISSDFIVLEEMDSDILRQEIMKSVIDDKFLNIDEQFETLVSILGKDNIDQQMISVFKFIQSSKNPKEYLNDCVDMYDDLAKLGFESTVWYQIISKKLESYLDECIGMLDKALLNCSDCEVLKEKNYNIIKADLESFIEIKQNLNNWDIAFELAKIKTFDRWKACTKSTNLGVVEQSKSLRDNAKALFEKKISIYLCQDMQSIKKDGQKLYDAVSSIKNIIFDFYNKYDAEKLKKNSLDFNDAEHLMMKLLTKNSGEIVGKSDIASEISRKYAEIMVDEYQDTNEIQDSIFKLISRDEQNLFMVGDVKQSIYKFRLADPTIFLEKYVNFASVKDACDNQSRKIVLSKNFRSRADVLDACNYVFENIMTKNAGDIDYDDEQKLYLGSKYEENSKMKAVFSLVDYDKFDETIKPVEVEAKVIAEKISKIINDGQVVFDKTLGIYRAIKPSDIVILLRSAKNKAHFYKKELENQGFAVDFKEGTEKLFGTPEVSFLISLFKIIDNNMLDIEMVSVLRSPVFEFSDDKIACLRNKNFSLFKNLQDKQDDAQCRDFLEKIQDVYKFSCNNSIFSTIWYVFDKLDVLSIYSMMDFGEKRYQNLVRFAEFVQTFDKDMTVYNFVRFIDKVFEKNAHLPSCLSGKESVKIMTIHQSKGLEFPVVFLADMSKEFNFLDLRNDVAMHNRLGISLKCTDEENIMFYPSIMQKAVRIEQKNEIVSEEMRVLYVAMTRAKEKLYMMCTTKKAKSQFEKWVNFKISDNKILECNSYMDWLGLSVVRLKSSKMYYETFDYIEKNSIIPDIEDVIECEYIDSFNMLDNNQAIILKKIEPFKPHIYNFIDDTKTPSKITATSIKKEKMKLNHFEKNEHKYIKKPKFISGKNILSPSEKGIAHHVVMQFIDFFKCKDEKSTKEQIEVLFDKEIITKDQFEAVDSQKIWGFIKSDIGQKIIKNHHVREFKFSILKDANEFYQTDSKEKVLLQGVVDCIVFFEDAISIIDYKTDFINDENIDQVSSMYKNQIDVYAKAMSEVYGLPVKERILYYFKNQSFVYV